MRTSLPRELLRFFVVCAVAIGLMAVVASFVRNEQPPASAITAEPLPQTMLHDREQVQRAARAFFCELDPDDGGEVRIACAYKTDPPTCWGVYGSLFVVLDCDEIECVPRAR